MPAQHKAIVVQYPHAPFTVETVAIPVPAKSEVLLRVVAVGLNPVDDRRRKLAVLIDEYPAILGSDIVGVVEDVGEDMMNSFKKGDEVFALTFGGGYGQYVVLPGVLLIRKPSNITFEQAASVPAGFVTACIGLFAPSPIGVGLNPNFSWDPSHGDKAALVIGAGTSVGQFAIQLFKFLGFKRIIAYASATHSDYLASLGATEVIDRHGVPLADLPAHASLFKAPIDVVYDVTFGGAPDSISINIAFEIVRDGGKIVAANPIAPFVASGSKQVELCRVQGLYAGPDILPPKNKQMVGYRLTEAHTTFGKLIIQHLPDMLEKKVVVPNRVEILADGLNGILEGLARWEKGKVSGVKLVGHPQEA